MVEKLMAAGLSSSSWVMILCCRYGNCWDLQERVISVVDGVVRMIWGLLYVYCWWVCGVIFTVSLCISECVAMGVVGAAVVVTLIIASLVVSLKILFSCSNAWRYLDVSCDFLLSLMISTKGLWLFVLYNSMVGYYGAELWKKCDTFADLILLNVHYTCGNIDSDI